MPLPEHGSEKPALPMPGQDFLAGAPSSTGAAKPRMLVVELWGLGDLIIATPFLQAASRNYEVTLLAKPFAKDLAPRFWPEVSVYPFVAPWTAFQRKYHLLTWPWGKILRLRGLARNHFEVALSARWDPRDHLLLELTRARQRLGFPRLFSRIFLTTALERPQLLSHRYEHWRVLGNYLGVELPPPGRISRPRPNPGGEVLLHSGAGQPVRVWPIERYHRMAARLRKMGYRVQIASDPDQRDWWLNAGEPAVAVPRTVAELLTLVDRAAVFVGNDSGPAHLSAQCGVPTFTLFGPQVPEWFAPLHPSGVWVEGKPCPYKPCSDYCRLPAAHCMVALGEEEVWSHLLPFLERTFPPAARPAAATPLPA